MGTEVLRPNAAGTDSGWTPVGAATNWEAVDEASADDDTTYMSITDGFSVSQTENLQATALTTETVSSVDTWDRGKDVVSSVDFLATGVKLGANTTIPDSTQLGTGYANVEQAALARPGGGAWAVSDLNSLEVVHSISGTGENRLTQTWVEVNWTAAVTRLPQSLNINQAVTRAAYW